MLTPKKLALSILAALLALLVHLAPARANTLVGGTITTNTTWTTANSPYEVTSEVVVYNLATLTIQPGVTVLFRSNTGLVIGYYNYDYTAINNAERGALVVNGTAAQPVTFTSTSGAAGGWKGLAFGNATDYGGLTSSIKYLTVQKAGQAQTLAGTVGSTSANILLFNTGTNFTWDHVEANDGSGYGWYFSSSAFGTGGVVATTCAARRNASWNLVMFSSSGTTSAFTTTQSSIGGAYLDHTTIGFTSPTVSLNPEGVHVRNSAFPTFTGATFDSNTNYSLYTEDLASNTVVTGSTVSGNGKGADTIAGTGDDSYVMRVSIGSTVNTNSFSGNGKQGIEMVGGAMTSSGRWYLPGSGTFQPYVVLNETVVYNLANLTVDAGVTVQFASATGLIIGYYNYDYTAINNVERGTFTVNGTNALPVLFTSQSGATGAWKGLAFGNASDYGGLVCTLHYLTVEKAGQGQTLNGTVGSTAADLMMFNTGSGWVWDHVQTNQSSNIGLYLSSSTLNSSTGAATGNASNGVHAQSSTLTFTGGTVSSNGGHGIYLGSTGGTVSGCTLNQNSGYGIDLTGAAPNLNTNTISNSGQYAIRYPIGNAPSITGNTLTTNTKPGIEVVGGALTTSHSWNLQTGETFYTVTGSEIVVYNLATLTVAGGSTVKFSSGTGLVIGYYNYDYTAINNVERGLLNVAGTAALPVLFTSTSGAAGGWKGLAFGNATDYGGLTSSIKYLTVEKAGQGQTLGNTVGSTSADILVFNTGTNFTWDHVEANDGSGYGWYFSSSVFGTGGVVSTSCAARRNTSWNLVMFSSSGTSSAFTTTQSGTGGAYLDRTTIGFTGPTVSLNPEGVHVRNASLPTFTGATFDSNTNYSLYTEDLASNTVVTGSTVSSNGKGADTIAGTGDDSYTMRVSIGSTVNTNSFSGNGKQGIEMVGGAMTSSGRWYLPGSGTFQPYVLLNETVVYNLANLTVDAGVTVQFASATGLIIGYYNYDYTAINNVERGTFTVNGTNALPVLFTSQSGATGAWKGLAFGNASDYGGLVCTLHYLTVEKAGQGQTLNGTVGSTSADLMMFNTGGTWAWDHVQTNQSSNIGLYLSSSTLNTGTGAATGNAGNGVHAQSSNLSLNGATISNNGGHGVYLGATVGNVSTCTINQNTGYGIDLTGAAPTIASNTISNSGQYAVRYPIGNAPSITNNTLSGDAKPGIEVVGGALTTSHTWATQKGEPFFTVTGSEVVVYNLATLTVAAGNTIKYSSGTGLVVGYYNYDYTAINNVERGVLSVQGTSSAPVLFTAASGVVGSWKGLAFGNASDYGGLLSTVNYLIVEKGGQGQTLGGTVGSTSANVMMFNTTVALNNLTVAQSSAAGIYSSASSPTVKNTIVAFNGTFGLVAAGGGAPSFTFGDLFSNPSGNSGWSAGGGSKAVDPKLTNYVGGDYRLLVGSPCIDAGTAIAGLSFLGAAPDMGALEFGADVNCANPSIPNGTPCNDSNACTQSDSCSGGACVGTNPIVCAASDQCHAAGTCNPVNGACSNPAKVDGTACNDGNACTQTDTCVTGTCTGASPIVCSALDVCHSVGTCTPATGVCTNPVIGNGVLATYYRDLDADGFGNAASTSQACSQPVGYVANNTDCNDGNAGVHPGAPELCNTIDDNCNGQIDEGLTTTYYADADGDGFGNPAATLAACSTPPGYVANNTDCNDASAAIHPGAAELCNSLDDNCNGAADEGNPGGGAVCATGKPGVCAGGTTSCTAGAVVCNQSQAASAEICDGLDNDCDGQVDNGVLGTWYADADGDGYGNPAASTQACSSPPGYVASNTDCNDASAGIHPGAFDFCDGIDQNCNGQIDEDGGFTYFADTDGDGYGNPAQTQHSCGAAPPGYVADASDCDDTRAFVHPGAAEICDGIDQNCNGAIDEGNPGGNQGCATGVPGVCAIGVTACSGGAIGCVQITFPSVEICDGIDNDCDGQTDEGGTNAFYADADGDGHGTLSTLIQSCFAPPGYVPLGNDCDDTRASVYPGAPELCDGLDNDCDGQVDEGNPGGNAACSTGAPGACSAGTTACVGGALHCNQNAQPSVEVCDGTDNDCDGLTDEGNPGGNVACSTGQLGVCAGGTTACSGGSLLCHQTNQPSAEICDGLDNDCDGQTDEGNPGGNAACSTGKPGVCAAGTTVCSGGAVVCAQDQAASAELCDGLDNDCNGQVDEGNPGGNQACLSGKFGVCAAGTSSCVSGVLHCTQNAQPGVETCNGLDDNCDGQIDEGLQPTFFLDADHDGFGTPNMSIKGCNQPVGYVLNSGDCNDSNPNIHPGVPELCNNVDDNCNDVIDEGTNAVQADCDHSGVGDICKPDGDGDGVPDVCDNCPGSPNPSQADGDHDGNGDACDPICLTIQRGVLGDVADTYIVNTPSDIGSNFGPRAYLYTDSVRRALLRFDLDPLPPSAEVTSATVTLYERNTGAAVVRVHRILAPWLEDTVTWSSFNSAFAPAITTSFINGGALYSGPITFDLTALVKAWLAGAFPNDGVLLEESVVPRTTFQSSEAAAANQRPRLSVCYTSPL